MRLKNIFYRWCIGIIALSVQFLLTVSLRLFPGSRLWERHRCLPCSIIPVDLRCLLVSDSGSCYVYPPLPPLSPSGPLPAPPHRSSLPPFSLFFTYSVRGPLNVALILLSPFRRALHSTPAESYVSLSDSGRAACLAFLYSIPYSCILTGRIMAFPQTMTDWPTPGCYHPICYYLVPTFYSVRAQRPIVALTLRALVALQPSRFAYGSCDCDTQKEGPLAAVLLSHLFTSFSDFSRVSRANGRLLSIHE